MRKLVTLGAAVGAVCLSLASCQLVQIGAAGYGGYMAYKTFLTGSEAGSLAKGMRNAKPVFVGYEAVKAEAQLRPRDEGKAAELAAAFADNLGYLVEQDAGIVGGSIKACYSGKRKGCRQIPLMSI